MGHQWIFHGNYIYLLKHIPSHFQHREHIVIFNRRNKITHFRKIENIRILKKMKQQLLLFPLILVTPMAFREIKPLRETDIQSHQPQQISYDH